MTTKQDTEKAASGRLSRLSTKQQEVVTTLRETQRPLTYDRIGFKLGYTGFDNRNVSSLCRKLRDAGIVHVAKRGRTIGGLGANGYALRPPFDRAPLPWTQGTLFRITDHAPDAKQRTISLILRIGTGQAAPREVSIAILDALIGIQIADDMILAIDEGPTTLPYQAGSETSEAAAKNAKWFASAKRRRAYLGVVQGHRRTGRGLTRSELWRETSMLMQTLLPRIVELRDNGYVAEAAPIRDPLTGRMQKPLLPKGEIALVSLGASRFYADRMQLIENIEGLLKTTQIYLGDPERVYSSASRWAEGFIAKHARPLPKAGEMLDDEEDDPEDDEAEDTEEEA